MARLEAKQQALVFGHALPLPVVVRTREYGEELYSSVVRNGNRNSQRVEDGVSAAECARALAGDGADIVGLVCNGTPEKMLELVVEMRNAVDVPVSWQPNGFGPGGKDTRISPDEMAEYALKAAAEGINMIGSCCGTGPSHIRAMAEALDIHQEPA